MFDQPETACEAKPLMEVKQTISGKLAEKKARLESQLAEVNAALDALTKNPEVANLFDLVVKATRF